MSNEFPIAVSGLSVSYERKRVLTAIYANIREGRVVGVIGPNGAGKSTLFKAILGLLVPNAGTVSIYGRPIEEQRRRVAYVPQKDDVDWTFPATALDVVLFGRYPFKKLLERIDKTDRAIAMQALEELGIADLHDRQIGALSGGQQQRVFLARALCQQADIFLLDEPFVGVDMTTERRIIEILKRLGSEGKTTLVVHHDLASVQAYFDDILLLNQRLIAYGPTAETFTEDNISKTYGPQLTMLHKAGGAQ